MMNRQFPTVARLEAYLAEQYPFMAGGVGSGRNDFGAVWEARFEETLAALVPGEEALRQAVDGYVEFALDALRLHRRFEKNPVYDAKTYEEAAREVYHNPDYMSRLYLPGILLSHFLWPHHYRQRVFFESTFLDDMRRAGATRFFDVGIGSGYYSRLMLMALPKATGRGFDVSESSRAYTERQLRAFGVGDRYQITLGDITASKPDQTAHWLISVEVLEHLEDPLAFLRALRNLLTPGGKAFITAALDAPNADHIFLYRRPEEVEAQLVEADFAVEQYHLGAAYRARHKGVPVPLIAAFIVT